MEERIRVFDVWVNIWREGEGPPLFILPGWNGTFPIYQDLLNEFVKRGFSVYAIEFPGSGKSDAPPREWRFPEFVCLIDAVYGHYAIKQDAYVLGHSWGSVTALQFARYFPYRVKKLVLVSSPVLKKGKFHIGKININVRMPSWMFDTGFWLFAILLKPSFWIIKSFSLLAKVLPLYRVWHRLHYSKVQFAMDWLDWQYLFLTNNKGIMRKVLRAVIEIDTGEDARSVECQTFLIWGEKDILTPQRNKEVFCKNMKDAKIFVFPQGSHHYAGQWAEKLAHIVDEWLKKD
jgi:pimeloyl-ACP methyl ester carboxylesterase